jgi:hypothetical protein
LITCRRYFLRIRKMPLGNADTRAKKN